MPRIQRDIVALGVARMADAVANSFLIIVLPLYVASERVTGTLIGLPEAAISGIVLGVFGLVNAGVQPFSGRLSDRVGRRKVFVIGGLIFVAAMNLLYSVAGGYLSLILIRMGQGLGVAFTVTASLALVNEVSVTGSRGGNMGTYNALRLIGFGAGPLAAGFIVSGGPYALPRGLTISGFDATFYMATALALVSAALVELLVREPPRPTARVGALHVPILARDGAGLLHPIFALGIATLIMATCISVVAPIETEVNAHLGQDARWFGIQFAVFIFSLALTQPLVGHASDRWGRRVFVIAGLVCLAPTTLAQGLVATPWQMVGARLAQGVAGSMAFAPALALAGDLAEEGQSGLQLSVLTMAFGLGLSAGQLLGGFLVGWGYAAPFALAAALALLAAAVVMREVAPG